MRQALIGLAILGLLSTAQAKGKRAPVRELKNAPAIKESRDIRQPTAVTSLAEAEKLFGKEVAGKLALDVDFASEQILFFAWSGSGGDRLSATLKKTDTEEVAVFEYTRGLTKDLHRHSRAFVIPKKAKWEFAGKK